MTLSLPRKTKHARIVHMVGQLMSRLQLRLVRGDWVVIAIDAGPSVAKDADRLHRAASRRG